MKRKSGNRVEREKFTLTSSDLNILRVLQSQALSTIDELAQSANLSPSSAQRRVQRLKDQKIIVAHVAVANPKALGFNLTMIVELEVDHDKPERQLALNNWINKRPEIQNAWHITGRGDYMLTVIVRSIEHFDELMTSLMNQNPNVRKYTTSVALKTLKQSLAVPCDI
jgi:Lrp/AsnC family transcriptional regulator, leucine-responsive regulatory protein